MPALVVFCTCPEASIAQAIAHNLVEMRLAACVSVLPGVRSTYRWQDGIELSEEVQLLIKTSSQRFEALQTLVLAMHPYELPELIAVEAVAGLDRYLDWVGESTTPVADS
jgi:periplasmic divalent cation tolerance protein